MYSLCLINTHFLCFCLNAMQSTVRIVIFNILPSTTYILNRGKLTCLASSSILVFKFPSDNGVYLSNNGAMNSGYIVINNNEVRTANTHNQMKKKRPPHLTILMVAAVIGTVITWITMKFLILSLVKNPKD